MVAATWVCGQFVQTTMKPDAAKITPPTRPAARDSRSRAANSMVNPIATASSSSLA